MAFPTLSVSGLTFTEIATTEVASANDTQMFISSEGVMFLPKATGGLTSTDGVTWSNDDIEGPGQGGHKCAIDLGLDEILSIHRTTLDAEDGLYEVVLKRSNNGWSTVIDDEGRLDVPLSVPLAGDAGDTEDGFLFHHGLVIARNGDLIASLYGNYAGDEALADGYPTKWGFRKYRTVTVKSQNQGETWGDPKTVAYDKMLARGTSTDFAVKTYASVPALTQEGFNESELVQAPNGDLLCFMRTGGRLSFNESPVYPTPLYMSRSVDDGETWEYPVQVADRGTNPNAATLASGVIVVVYTNPGTWLMFSDDNGYTWKGHTQISTASSYADIVAYDEDTVAIAYYDSDAVQVTKLRVVRTGQPVAPHIFFVANPHRIASGQSTTLTWNTINANNGRLSGGTWGSGTAVGASSSGISTGALTQDTTYTIRFESVSHPGTFREVQRTVYVT